MIPVYVITLKKSNNINNFELIYKNNNINYNKFYGVDARYKEHLKYSNLIHPIAKIFTPNNILGCTISHILLAKEIVKNKHDYTLILEDDCYAFNFETLEQDINNIINKFNNFNKNWDIINLHTDGILQTNNIYINCFSGSTAAYIISLKGAKKLANYYAYHNIDVFTSNNSNFLKYKTSNNLFWTDENSSILRNNKNNIIKNIYSYLLSFLFLFRGEKTWYHLLSYDVFKIPFSEINIEAYFLLVFVNLYILYKIYIKFNN